MGFKLEDRSGLTMENINILATIADTTGVNIAEHDLSSDFSAAFYKTLTFETLQDLLQGKAGKLAESTLAQLQAEMDRRYSNALAD